MHKGHEQTANYLSADMALEDALVREKEKRVLKLIAEREKVNKSFDTDAGDAGAG
jgi:hypothetical protein